MDVLTKDQRRKNMQAIRSKGSAMEIALAKALWTRGYRYRKHNKKVFGNPDFTFSKYKVAIFVDSEYFHGKEWEKNKYRIQSNREFWWKKIEGNIARDQLVIHTLTLGGWIVLRFWTDDIRKNLANCVASIERALEERKCQRNIPTSKKD